MPIYDDDRSAWGAAAARPMYSVPVTTRTEFFIHYDGGSPLGLGAGSHDACLARVKADQRFHQWTRGWADIGYNYLICPHARVIEGRGRDWVGAHCPDHNRSGIGVQVMIGGSERVTDDVLRRVVRLHADLSAAAGRSLVKRGHRDGYATDCPGSWLYAWVKAGMPILAAPTPQVVWHYPGKVMRRGSTGPGVSRLQRLLNEYGRYGLAVDGDFGRATLAAVRDAQKRLAVAVDGEVGPETWGALAKALVKE